MDMKGFEAGRNCGGAGALVEWLWEMTHVREVVGLNPCV